MQITIERAARRDQAAREALEREAAIRDQVTRELARILEVTKSGERVIAERLDDALLNALTVKAITSLSSSEMDRRIAMGTFPKPIKLGLANRWFLSDVAAWIAARREEHIEAQRADTRRKVGLPPIKRAPAKRPLVAEGACNAQG